METATVACIMDCPTITFHIGKCYKALIDSGAAISLIRYSTYQLIDDSFKTPIQPRNTRLNTVDGSAMMALGMTVLHLKIADFKFTHSFIICNILVSKYTNKHITFNKGEYVVHLEPVIVDNVDSDLPSHAQQHTYSTNSVTTQ